MFRNTEQAALSEEERFEQLHASAFRKSMRRKTMKQMKAVEEARKLAHAMQEAAAVKPYVWLACCRVFFFLLAVFAI